MRNPPPLRPRSSTTFRLNLFLFTPYHSITLHFFVADPLFASQYPLILMTNRIATAAELNQLVNRAIEKTLLAGGKIFLSENAYYRNKGNPFADPIELKGQELVDMRKEIEDLLWRWEGVDKAICISKEEFADMRFSNCDFGALMNFGTRAADGMIL